MTELEHPTGRRLSLDPAGPATVVNATDKHGYIAHPEPVVYVSTHDLPRIVEIAHVLPRSLMAQIDAFVAQLGKERVPLDLGIGERDHAPDVAPTERIHDLNCQLHVRLRHRLPGQPRGLEGLLPVAVNIDAADLAVAHMEGGGPVEVERYPARLPFTHRVHAHDDAALALDHSLDIHHAPPLLERLHQGLPEVNDGLRADADALTGELRRVVPHHVGMELAYSLPIVAAPSAPARRSSDLHVRLRHRLLLLPHGFE